MTEGQEVSGDSKGETMRVLFDSRLAVRGLGIGSATQRLTPALQALPTVNLHVNQASRGWCAKGKVETLARSGLLDLNPNWDLRSRNADVVHYFGNTAPTFPSRCTIITVHDLMSIKATSLRAGIFTSLLLPGLRRSPPGQVVAISTQTASDLLKAVPSLRPTVHVIPNGHRPGLFSMAERRHILMFGGQGDLRKRVGLGLAAYSSYAATTSTPLPLIVAGRAGITPSFADEYVRSGRVSIERDPSNARVAALLENAACVVYPSSEEGFGLPIVEAGEVGTPVLCGQDARIPAEVKGTHVVHVVGTNPTEWGRGLTEAVAMGPCEGALGHLPTWAQVADAYAELYRRVAT